MSKNPANRSVAGHIKEGFKNIPKTYKALYNQPKTTNPGASGKGVGKTIKDNVKYIVKGPPKSITQTPQQKKNTNQLRTTTAVMGAASVTPVGPIAAFALGVKKSVADQKKALGKTTGAPKTTTPKLNIKPGAKPGK